MYLCLVIKPIRENYNIFILHKSIYFTNGIRRGYRYDFAKISISIFLLFFSADINKKYLYSLDSTRERFTPIILYFICSKSYNYTY